MSRAFDTRNAERPTWWARVVATVPACYSPENWETYLDGVAREACSDNTLRRRLERGGTPDHCVGCSAAGRIAMQKVGRCQPLTKRSAKSEAPVPPELETTRVRAA